MDAAAMADDFDLLRAWRSGDVKAGNTLVQRHFDRLYRFFRPHLDDGLSDLIQCTWLVCAEKIEHIHDTPRFEAFLLGVAHKELLRHFRKLYRGQRAMRKLAATSSLVTSPTEAVAARDERDLLRWALRQLPVDARIVLVLHYWEELSIAESSAILRVPPGTIKSRLHRARGQLRRVMEQPDAHEGTHRHNRSAPRKTPQRPPIAARTEARPITSRLGRS